MDEEVRQYIANGDKLKKHGVATSKLGSIAEIKNGVKYMIFFKITPQSDDGG